MFKQILLVFFICNLSASNVRDLENFSENKIVLSTKRIKLDNFPGAFNPSIIPFNQGYLLTFRYCPENDYTSYIGIVLLDDVFEQISEPQLLNTRTKTSKTPSQTEDARIFSYRNRLFLIYNDNIEVVAPSTQERRDMFMAELLYSDNKFQLSAPLKLIYEKKYNQRWQKNWVPFVWNKKLLLTYSIDPHEILEPNLSNGACYLFHETEGNINWKLGILRGSTPPLLVDGEYLAFFHSGTVTSSSASWNLPLWHYFMGAYTFSANPPFEITKITPEPLIAEGFYTPSNHEKRVILPGGYAVSGPFLYVAYAKDDCEIWIATLDKNALKNAMIPVKKED